MSRSSNNAMKLLIDETADRGRAEQIADRYGFVLCMEANPSELCLRLDAEQLILTDGELSVCGDCTRILPRTEHGRLSTELLYKAAKRKTFGEHPVAWDATAGLGEDAFLLAAAGFFVRLYERDPVIAALLEDALIRGLKNPETAETVSRMSLFYEDSIAAMEALSKGSEAHGSGTGTEAREEIPDVILLDPMFPERRKSALIKKKFQLLQKLERPCADGEELLSAALRTGAKRILIKRPAKGPFLAGRTPDYSLTGKAVRVDCIVRA